MLNAQNAQHIVTLHFFCSPREDQSTACAVTGWCWLCCCDDAAEVFDYKCQVLYLVYSVCSLLNLFSIYYGWKLIALLLLIKYSESNIIHLKTAFKCLDLWWWYISLKILSPKEKSSQISRGYPTPMSIFIILYLIGQLCMCVCPCARVCL